MGRWYERNAKVASQVIATVTCHPKGGGARSFLAWSAVHGLATLLIDGPL